MMTAMQRTACATARTECDAPRGTQRVRSPGFSRWDVANTGVGQWERPRSATPWPPEVGTPNPAERRRARRASRRWLGAPALAGGARGAPALGNGSADGIRCLGRLKAGLRTSGSAAACPRGRDHVGRLGLAVAPAHRARFGISSLSLAPGFTDCVKTPIARGSRRREEADSGAFRTSCLRLVTSAATISHSLFSQVLRAGEAGSRFNGLGGRASHGDTGGKPLKRLGRFAFPGTRPNSLCENIPRTADPGRSNGVAADSSPRREPWVTRPCEASRGAAAEPHANRRSDRAFCRPLRG